MDQVPTYCFVPPLRMYYDAGSVLGLRSRSDADGQPAFFVDSLRRPAVLCGRHVSLPANIKRGGNIYSKRGFITWVDFHLYCHFGSLSLLLLLLLVLLLVLMLLLLLVLLCKGQGGFQEPESMVFIRGLYMKRGKWLCPWVSIPRESPKSPD